MLVDAKSAHRRQVRAVQGSGRSLILSNGAGNHAHKIASGRAMAYQYTGAQTCTGHQPRP
jgi:hypothetical protein